VVKEVSSLLSVPCNSRWLLLWVRGVCLWGV